MARIYVASSWRNQHQEGVVRALRDYGHDVYDFKDPPGRTWFSWRQVDATGDPCGAEELQRMLDHPVARAGFLSDYGAMAYADVFVLVLPAGRSAHLEAGWAVGSGRPVVVYLPDDSPQEPDLMYLMCASIVSSIGQLIEEIRDNA